MLKPLDDALLPNSEVELEAELEELEKRQKLCAKHLAELMKKENMENKIYFPQEIHEAKQLKGMLTYQQAVRVAKRNRLRMGLE